MNRKIKILIVDDHLIFRIGIRSLLMKESDMEVIGEAKDHREAIEKFIALKPDLVLVDMRMPGRGGVDVLVDIREIQSDANALVLSSFANEEEIYHAIHAGARGYLLKDVGRDELVQAIHVIAAGHRHIPPAIQALLDERASKPDLTSREIDVLQLLVKGLTNREIGSVLGKSENTIRNHTINIFAKLEVTDRAEAVSVALQRGIVVPIA